MKLTNLTIKDLLNENEKLTFLVGAGCSVDAPSCLPTGDQMKEPLIRYFCAKSEINTLLKLKDLKFEELLKIILNHADKELKLVDYYGTCDKPNIQHFFFAEMIKKGHFVMTTNFDYLIEYALLQSNVPREDVISVITKEDYEKYSNPSELFKQGKKVVYKLHGAFKNIITNEDTKKSLVDSIIGNKFLRIISLMGYSKEEKVENEFKLSPYKRPLFDNISNGRNTIVMGYSGKNDLDFVSSLRILKNHSNFIWINHINTQSSDPLIHKF